MKTEVIVGIFSISGTLIGGLLSILGTRINIRKKEMKEDIAELTDQINSYWYLETLYAEEYIKATNSKKSVKSIKTQFRKKIQTAGHGRPTLTALEAQELKKKWRTT